MVNFWSLSHSASPEHWTQCSFQNPLLTCLLNNSTPLFLLPHGMLLLNSLRCPYLPHGIKYHLYSLDSQSFPSALISSLSSRITYPAGYVLHSPEEVNLGSFSKSSLSSLISHHRAPSFSVLLKSSLPFNPRSNPTATVKLCTFHYLICYHSNQDALSNPLWGNETASWLISPFHSCYIRPVLHATAGRIF